MPLSHFIPAYPSPSPCPQVHSLRQRLYSCPARWGRSAGCDIVRPGSGHWEELVQSRSRKPERRPWGWSRETRSLRMIVRETPQDMGPVRKGKEFCYFLCISSPLIQWPPHKAPGRFGFFFSFFKIYLFIYLFLAVLGLRFCARAFSSCGERGPLFIAVRGPLTVAASLVAGHRLQTRRLSNCGSRA